MAAVIEDVRSLIDSFEGEGSPSQVHDLLLRVEGIVGVRPLHVTGPGPSFVWRLGDRGMRVYLWGSGSVGVEDFDWAERDAEEYQAFTWEESNEYLPYLWRLPIEGAVEWAPGSRIVATWADFFRCYDACMNRMPAELAVVPPAWLGRQPAVTTLWNLTSDRFVTAAVGVSADGIVLDLTRSDSSEARIVVPADQLGTDAVNLPAVMAGLTASGDLRELEFFDLDIDPEGCYPIGIKEGDPDDLIAEGATPGGPPPAMQTVDEVAAILAGAATAAQATTAPAPATTAPAPPEPAPVEPATPAAPPAPTAQQDDGVPRKRKWFWQR